MSEYDLHQARKAIYAKWFAGKITYDVMNSEIRTIDRAYAQAKAR